MNDKIPIFYSWQNDVAPNTHRFLIKNAISNASRNKIFEEYSFNIDESTANTPGTPEIVSTIFEKISKSAIFICDITPICKIGNEVHKLIPNPNVMLELGYAAHSLSWRNILCIVDADKITGKMPFDVITRRHVSYSSSNPEAQKELTNKLIQALKAIIGQENFENRIKLAGTRREKDIAVINNVLREFNFKCFDHYAESILSARIPTDIFLYWEGFYREIESTLFILENKKIESALTNLYTNWKIALSYSGQMGWDMVGDYYVASKPTNKKFLQESIKYVACAHDNAREISRIIHTDFPEINILETDKNSFTRMAPYRN